MKRKLLPLASLALAALAGNAFAAVPQPYDPSRPIIPPAPGSGIQSPPAVSGKEYTDLPDIDQTSAPDPSRILYWDGLGGVADGPKLSAEWQLDALANHGDALFNEVAYLNSASLVVSVTGDSPTDSIWYENPGGARAVWASKAQVNVNGVADLDALELWGAELVSDSTTVSYAADPLGFSVWSNAGFPLITQTQIANAISPSIGLPPGVLPPELIDLDALMAFGFFEPSSFTGDILFSVAPIPGLLDGGEVWVWTVGSPAATFLSHGGHLWDTAFDVRAAFGVENENIDALEAIGYNDIPPVPEPATVFGAAALAALAAARRLRRKTA